MYKQIASKPMVNTQKGYVGEMSGDEEAGLLLVDTILDSCVLAEGKRWYQVKWKPMWMTEDVLPAGTLDTYKKDKVINDENDGAYHIGEERKTEGGAVEYQLIRGNTWESEDKLNTIDPHIVYNYWSQQSDLKEIVKIEEDFDEYESHVNSSGVTQSTVEGESSSDSETPGISMKDGSSVPVTVIKREGEQVDSLDNRPAEDLADQTSVESGTDDYQCAKCNSLFISGKMKDFLTNNEKANAYSHCMKCGETYCPRCSVNMGELRHNGKTSLFCDECIEGFANHSEKTKIKIVNKKRVKRKASNVKRVGGKAKMKDLPNTNDTQKEFSCEICGRSFDSMSSVKEHEIVVTGANTFQCGECFRSITQLSRGKNSEMLQYCMPVVLQPMATVIDNQSNGVTNAGMQQVAGQGITVLSGKHKDHVVHKAMHFENNPLTGKHSKTHTGNVKVISEDKKRSIPLDDDGALEISTDSLEYVEEEGIDVHYDDEIDVGKMMKDDAPEGNYRCFHCGRTFNRQYTLDTHQRIHTGEKPYVCEICGARFRQSGTKLNHVRAVHTKERPFQCQYCGKTFSHKSSITVHIRIHTKEKPYQCKTCERCFTDRATYLKHQSIHSGVKPYGCPMCTRKFSQKSNLKRHYKNIHELGKPDNCEVASGSTDGSEGIVVGDLTDRRDLFSVSAAMSEISSMPEYPHAAEMAALSQTSPIKPQTLQHTPEENTQKDFESIPPTYIAQTYTVTVETLPEGSSCNALPDTTAATTVLPVSNAVVEAASTL